MYVNSIKSLKDSFDLFKYASDEESKKQARSDFLADCGVYYEKQNLGHSYLYDDQFLRKAKKVSKDAILFQGHEVQIQTKELAQNYLNAWQKVKEGFRTETPEQSLGDEVKGLVESHITFVRPLADTSIGSRLKFPNTLLLFYTASAAFLARNPRFIPEVREWISERDFRLPTWVPCTAIIEIISKPFIPEELPECLQPFAESLQTLRDAYERLDDQKKACLANLILEDSIGQSKKVARLHQSIRSVVEQCRVRTQPRCWNAILQNAVSDLEIDLGLAKRLQGHSALDSMSEMVDFSETDLGEEVRKFLSAFSEEEYAEARRVFKFLPEDQRGLPSSDWERNPDFARIITVMTLAQGLQRAD